MMYQNIFDGFDRLSRIGLDTPILDAMTEKDRRYEGSLLLKPTTEVNGFPAYCYPDGTIEVAMYHKDGTAASDPAILYALAHELAERAYPGYDHGLVDLKGMEMLAKAFEFGVQTGRQRVGMLEQGYGGEDAAIARDYFKHKDNPVARLILGEVV
jgi:hypothetical protein